MSWIRQAFFGTSQSAEKTRSRISLRPSALFCALCVEVFLNAENVEGRGKQNFKVGRKNKLEITNALGRNLGMVLLGIWLILTGLLPLLNLRVSATVSTVLAVLAIAAGLLILLRR